MPDKNTVTKVVLRKDTLQELRKATYELDIDQVLLVANIIENDLWTLIPCNNYYKTKNRLDKRIHSV